MQSSLFIDQSKFLPSPMATSSDQKNQIADAGGEN